jgi:hypothetical protein
VDPDQLGDLVIDRCPASASSRAWRSLAGLIFRGRPPLRPRRRADASPAAVRSRIRSRSNSARAPKAWKTSFPLAVVVSIPSVRLLNPHALLGQAGDGVDQVAEAAAEAVQPPDHEGVAGAELFQGPVQRGALGEGAGHGVEVDPAGLDAGGLEGVALEVGVLVEGRDPPVANVHAPERSESQ